MGRTWRIRARRGDAGAAAVEFALVVPFLLLIVFATIGFGIMFAQKLALGNGAREAARYGVVENRTCADITAAAKNAATTIGMSGSDVDVSVKRGKTVGGATNVCGTTTAQPCKGSALGDSLYVFLEFDGEMVVPIPVAGEYTIDGVGVFRCEFS